MSLQINATPTLTDRIFAVVRQVIRGEFPQLTYLGTYEYQITNSYFTNGVKLYDGSPTSSIPLPPLVGVALSPGIPGMIISPTVGAKMNIKFINGDPTRPVVDSWDSSRGEVVSFDAEQLIRFGRPNAALPIPRLGDTSGRFIWDNMNMVLYYSPDATSPYVAVPNNPNASTPAPPDPSSTGQDILIATASSKVKAE